MFSKHISLQRYLIPAVPQVHEPQEVAPDGPVPEDGQRQQRAYTAERVHRRHHQHQ